MGIWNRWKKPEFAAAHVRDDLSEYPFLIIASLVVPATSKKVALLFRLVVQRCMITQRNLSIYIVYNNILTFARYLASSHATPGVDLKSKSLFRNRESALLRDANCIGLLFQVPCYKEQVLCVTKISVRKLFIAAHSISIYKERNTNLRECLVWR